MSRRQLIWLFVVIVAAGVSIVIGVNLMEFVRFKAWERSLKGPYQGAEASVSGAGTNLFVSLAKGATLTVFEDANQGTVISCRSASGRVQWARALIAEESSRDGDGTTNRTNLRNLSFQEMKMTSEGVKVVFVCDWDWGGRELGVLYLSPEFAFRGFSVGW